MPRPQPNFRFATAVLLAPCLAFAEPTVQPAARSPLHTVQPDARPSSGAYVTFAPSDPSATLEQETDDEWREACRGPCKVRLEPGATVRVGGSGVLNSREVKLSVGLVRVEADVASSAWRTSGIALVALGGVTVATGAVVAVMADACHQQPGCTSSSDSARTNGLIGVVAGTAAVIGGIYLLTSRSTDVRVEPASTLSLGRGVSLSPQGLRF